MLLVITAVHGRPEGASPAACGTTTDIVPSHAESSPSDTPLPYSVDLSDFTGGQYIPGDTYTSKKQHTKLMLAAFLSWHMYVQVVYR